MSENVSTLPAPQVIETLDFETIYQSILAQFQSILPDHDTLLESDPAIKLLQIAAYREILLRERINIVARASLLAFATDADLEHIGAPFGVFRLENESDEQLRERISLSLEAISTAGSIESYQYHATSAHGDIDDINVTSPEKGDVLISVLVKENITDEVISVILEAVNIKLSADKVRPITDNVNVQLAEDVPFSIDAQIFTDSDIQASSILALAEISLKTFIDDRRAIGKNVRLSAIDAALHVDGVTYINLISPSADILISDEQAGLCQSTTLTFGGVDE